ncbi:Uncharacterised protein [Mycobacteroides abscessus subsp. abscessus]|nr:Uncharacterised protein [Mycobacteroides abscessus subsp. abscessus]
MTASGTVVAYRHCREQSGVPGTQGRQCVGVRNPRNGMPEQSPCDVGRGTLEDGVHISVVDEPTAVEDSDRLAHVTNDIHLVGDHDDRRTEIGVDAAQQLQSVRRRLRIERARRLVGDENRR